MSVNEKLGDVLYKPEAKTLLFLSCDLVGSTQYKQSASRRSDSTWPEKFLKFYQEFPQQLARIEKDFCRKHKVNLKHSFNLWKPVGDELIFTYEIRDEPDAYFALRIWLETLEFYEADSLNDVSMKTKGGAFTATFPGPDVEATIPRTPTTGADSDRSAASLNLQALRTRHVNGTPDPNYIYDYVGPGIDTGFRVLATATHRDFVLSVEAAWLLVRGASALSNHWSDDAAKRCRFVGQRPLKGVWDSREYPIFAWDREYSDSVHGAMLPFGPTPPNLSDIEKLCWACLSDKNWVTRLYLPDSLMSDSAIRSCPSDVLVNSYDDKSGAESLPMDDSSDAQRTQSDADLEKLPTQ